jgi:hypothetical protein
MLISWFKQKLANWLSKDLSKIELQNKPKSFRNLYTLPGTLHGRGWVLNFPSFLKPYIPKYWTRTPDEHEAIRRRIQRDPKHCKHLKGGYWTSPAFKDYNISCHTFPNNQTRVRCLTCKKEWIPNSPDWAEAQMMLNNTTNRPTSSDVGLR